MHKNSKLIWLVDDDDSLRWILEKTFQKSNYEVVSFIDAVSALTRFKTLAASEQLGVTNLPDVILSDIRMPKLDGLAFLEKIHSVKPRLPVIIMTAHSDLEAALATYQAGAFDYLPKPFDLNDAVLLANKAIQNANTKAQDYNAHKELAYENNTHTGNSQLQKVSIIGQSLAMQAVFRAIGKLASTNVTVLINGESGTGKELIANAIHQSSPRKKKPFIALNMAAIPHDLVEAELFGYEKGAFTGATTQRKGRFEQADGGTLFLDEIGDMPYSTQTRLLRVLADNEFFRVGGQKPVTVDVRIIAATHQNLEQMVANKKFREDLFYRLNVIRIKSPALRERREDIPLLLNFFLNKIANEMKISPKSFTSEALTALTHFSWQGNVRQLENTCRYLMVMTTSNEIHSTDFPEEIQNQTNEFEPAENQPTQKNTDSVQTHPEQKEHKILPWQEVLAHQLKAHLEELPQDLANEDGGTEKTSTVGTKFTQEFERTIITTSLLHTKGRKGDAAKLLGWGRNTLTRKIQELNIRLQ